MINQQLSRFATHENSAYPSLWRGCVGAWCPSLGPSGAKLHDYSRSVNAGTYTNFTPQSDWQVSGGQYALNFDRVTNGRVAALPQLYALGGVSIWVYSRNTSYNYFFGKWSLSQRDCYLGATGGNWEFRVNDGATSFGTWITAPATANQWTHLIGTRDGANYRLYVDGVLAATGTTGGDIGGGNERVNIGWLEVGNPQTADCLIDDCRVYTRTLTAWDARLLSRRRGIAFTPRARRLTVPEQAAAGGATPWLYARRRSQIIGAGGVH